MEKSPIHGLDSQVKVLTDKQHRLLLIMIVFLKTKLTIIHTIMFILLIFIIIINLFIFVSLMIKLAVADCW